MLLMGEQLKRDQTVIEEVDWTSAYEVSEGKYPESIFTNC